MNGEDLRTALHNGRRVYGTLVLSSSPKWLKYIRNVGLDFVFFDTEHAAFNRETLSWMCYAYAAMDLAPVVRIPSPDPCDATQVLDGGACGILAPYIETVDQVRALVGAVKLKPVKGRKLEERLLGVAPFEPELERYVEQANRNNVLLINVESCAAIDRLEELVAVPGLDGVVIGPHDLSCSLGIPEQYDHPRFQEAVSHILRTSRRCGIGAGIHFMGDADREVVWARDAGLNLIIHNADLHSFVRTIGLEIRGIKHSLGE